MSPEMRKRKERLAKKKGELGKLNDKENQGNLFNNFV